MYASIMKAFSLLAPVLKPLFKEFHASRRQKNSVEQQNKRFEQRKENERRWAKSKSIIDIVGRSNTDA